MPSDFEQAEKAIVGEADLVAPVYRTYTLAMFYAQTLEERIGLLIYTYHVATVGAAQSAGTFVDFLCLIERAQRRPSPATMFAKKRDSLPTFVGQDTPEARERVAKDQARYVAYWKRHRKAP